VSGLLRGLLTAGLIGFGGGSALIPVIERQLVLKRPLLDEHTYLRHTVVANVTPGALPVKLAGFAGATVRGGGLALAAAAVVAAPGVLGTLGLLAASAALGPAAVRAVSHASVGITAFIIVLLIGYILRVHREGHPLWLFLAITTVSALLNGAGPLVRLGALLTGRPTDLSLPHLTAVQLIGLALAVIVGVSLFQRKSKPAGRPARPRNRGIWHATVVFVAAGALGIALFALIAGLPGLRVGGLLALSTVTSFGGGEAYIGVAEGFFVRSGLIGTQEFFTQLVPIANALPGPILVKVAAGVGFSFGGPSGPLVAWVLAGAAMLITVSASCAVALPVLATYDSLRDHPLMVNIGRYIMPVICGLLIQVCASMLEVSAGVAESAGIAATPLTWVTLAVVAVLSYVHLKALVPDTVLLLACGAASLLVLGL
jgi:chromate transporter